MLKFIRVGVIGISLMASAASLASGCGSWGDWEVVENTELSPAKIKFTYYGEQVTSVQVEAPQRYYLTISNVGTVSKKLIFHNDVRQLNSDELIEVLTKIWNFRDSHGDSNSSFDIIAEVHRVTKVNKEYADCTETPEGTKETITTYTFPMDLISGKRIMFTADDLVEERPTELAP